MDLLGHFLIAASVFSLLASLAGYLRRLRARPKVDPHLTTKARTYSGVYRGLRPSPERAQEMARTAEVDHALAYEIELLRL